MKVAAHGDCDRLVTFNRRDFAASERFGIARAAEQHEDGYWPLCPDASVGGVSGTEPSGD